jgi:hypothetical protein
MVPYTENVLKLNHGSGWRQRLQRLKVAFTPPTEMRRKEEISEADMNEKADELDWRERTGGWWW